MPNLGVQELLIIFLIVLVIFGARKLPSLGKGLGEGIKNFRHSLKGDDPAAGSESTEPGKNTDS